jgi:P4 family phage/plasmid primase-like protien
LIEKASRSMSILDEDSPGVKPAGIDASLPGRKDTTDAFAKHATALAAWVNKSLVNRRDVFGHYYQTDKRTTGTAFTDKSELTLSVLTRHFEGRDQGDLIGLHAIARDEADSESEVAACWSRWGAVDIDRHGDDGDPEVNRRYAVQLFERAKALGLSAILLDSNGAGGFHVVIVFDGPVPTERVFYLLKWLIRDWKAAGLATAPECFPKQSKIERAAFGNWLRLFGRHHTREHSTRVWSGSEWLEGTAAVKAILATRGASADLIPPEALPAKPEPPSRPRKSEVDDLTSDARLASEALRFVGHMVDGYDDWLLIGMSLRKLGSEGLALWEDWSRGSDKYKPGECERKWKSFESNSPSVKLGTLFKLAQRSGWSKPSVNGAGSGHSGSNGTPDDRPVSRPRRFNRTDLGNAERLVAWHGSDLRYCHPWSKWLVWDRKRWAEDQTGESRRRARKTVRAIYREASAEEDEEKRKELVQHAVSSEKRDRIAAMLYLGQAEAGIPILPGEMDADPWAFNFLNGTLDLRIGELRPHRRQDLITKLCPLNYVPDAPCPLWLRTLELFLVKSELIAYFRKIVGSAMAGVTRDHILPVCHGSGSNGKTTLLGMLLEGFGPDYAMKAMSDLLMAKKNETHPTDRADLFGKRLVIAIESEAGRRLNETQVKELTGGDTIRARRMREDPWEFKPSHTIMMATNHEPTIRGTDIGIWRRLKKIPFVVSLDDSQADKTMPEKLRGELAGIMAWAVQGCLEWQKEGLEPPADVVAATAEYRSKQDLIGAFLDEHTTTGPTFKVAASELYGRYSEWAKFANEFVISMKAFGMSMQERGLKPRKSSVMVYDGIGLKTFEDKQKEQASEREEYTF